MGRLCDRLVSWLAAERWLVGASLTRILLGTWAIYYYLLHYPVRGFLWGPGGIWPFDEFLNSAVSFNLLRWSPAPLYFEIVYHAAIVLAVAYTLGVWSRLCGALHWLVIWSLDDRNVFLGDGGDNIMRIVLLFLILVETGRYFSLDALRRRRPPGRRSGRPGTR